MLAVTLLHWGHPLRHDDPSANRNMNNQPSSIGDLPSYERPPVTEVVLSIQCASISGLMAVHIGLLWQELRTKYPRVTEHAPLGALFETFGAVAPAVPQFRIEPITGPIVSRFWFEQEDGIDLLQIQQDRIVHNWRRRTETQVYPRYEPIRAQFDSEVSTIVAFLACQDLGPIEPNQCEVTYTNILWLPDDMDPHRNLHRLTTLWRGWDAETELAPIENASLSMRYLMRSADIPVGRVYVDFQPVFYSTEAKPAVKLDITARGKPQENTIEAAFRLLDAERRAVVRTFDRVTTEEMQRVWGKMDVC